MRQRIDADVAFDLVDELEAGERVAAIDIHRTGAAYALAAGAPKGQRRIELVLDLDEGVEDHRPAGVEIDLEAVEPRILPVLGVPTVDLEGLDALRPPRRPHALAVAELGVGGQGELGHRSVLSSPALWAGSSAPRSRAY